MENHHLVGEFSIFSHVYSMVILTRCFLLPGRVHGINLMLVLFVRPPATEAIALVFPFKETSTGKTFPSSGPWQMWTWDFTTTCCRCQERSCLGRKHRSAALFSWFEANVLRCFKEISHNLFSRICGDKNPTS